MENKAKILYIDDEMNNLVGFKASLRLDYQILIAENVSKAYHYLEQYEDIKVIFCDQRMPEITGVQFFEDVQKKYPNPVRVLITAYTDVESIIDAINKGNIFRYVKKPWVESEIINAIQESIKYYQASSILAINNEELRSAYSELDKFAYSVSHDIRGPLVGLSGGISLALDTNNIDEIKDILRMMSKSVDKLDKFIINMHDYYSLERGKLKITSIDFNEIAKDLKDVYEIYAKSLAINFSITVSQEEDFWSDKINVNLILNNLIGNAIKYQRLECENKKVDVAITVLKGFATIKVSDNGHGIEEKYHDQIFTLFFRAHYYNVGSGLGLFNVKSAINKLNGKISVDSAVNHGSTFTAIIPNK
ncbi:ATP-binding protein [Pedobacter alpinus]|uniref:histidine kinase n=1 Tax=Pedobacter alpinus TaxID=1590643 RepID=A0ABW5TM40_9SPHI